MKILLLISFMANANFIRSADSSPSDFKNYLSSLNKDSYAKIQIDKLSELPPKTENLELALQELGNSDGSVFLLEKAAMDIQKEVLNLESRQILLFLLRRLLDTKNVDLNKQTMNRIVSLINNDKDMLDLVEDSELRKRIAHDTSNSRSIINLSKFLKSREDLADAQIYIDGIPVRVTNDWTAPSGIYQWTIFSNVYKKFIFVGTWDEFVAKLLSRKDLIRLVSGNCNEFKVISELERANTEIFFSPSCVKSAQSSKDFFTIGDSKLDNNNNTVHLSQLPQVSENKTKWLVPTLSLLAAGLAYSLKDKHVTFKSPGFTF